MINIFSVWEESGQSKKMSGVGSWQSSFKRILSWEIQITRLPWPSDFSYSNYWWNPLRLQYLTWRHLRLVWKKEGRGWVEMPFHILTKKFKQEEHKLNTVLNSGWSTMPIYSFIPFSNRNAFRIKLYAYMYLMSITKIAVSNGKMERAKFLAANFAALKPRPGIRWLHCCIWTPTRSS